MSKSRRIPTTDPGAAIIYPQKYRLVAGQSASARRVDSESRPRFRSIALAPATTLRTPLGEHRLRQDRRCAGAVDRNKELVPSHQSLLHRRMAGERRGQKLRSSRRKVRLRRYLAVGARVGEGPESTRSSRYALLRKRSCRPALGALLDDHLRDLRPLWDHLRRTFRPPAAVPGVDGRRG